MRGAAVAVVLALLAAATAGAGGGTSPMRAPDVPELSADAAGAGSGIRRPAAAAATWCGTPTTTDQAPNILAGHPVHWVYASPFDEPDRFSTQASLMQADAEAIDAWWRREDPTRTPRNDLAQLPCGAQLDLTSLRFPRPATDFVGGGAGFRAIVDTLKAAGFTSPQTKYVVYWDGLAEHDTCGRATSGFGESPPVGVAVVYVQACTGVAEAQTAAHELLHALGAVIAGPNRCGFHVCGDARDIMFPTASFGGLEPQLLDVGRDDYYGHARPDNTDIQDALWLVQLDRQVELRVDVTGPGRVTADVPGLDCTQSCTTTWNAGTQLRLAAAPAEGAKLVRWSGECDGTFPCVLTTGPGQSVRALFGPSAFRLTVVVAGRGTVRSTPRGIACSRPRCSASLSSYVPVRLTATPAKGWKLRRWTGACRGKKRSCTVPMSKQTSARAVFTSVPKRAR